MSGRRKALIVANDEYDHEGLQQLRAPAADARALADVLRDDDIGDFEVAVVLNEQAHTVAAKVEDLFSDCQSEDLLLLHFSCHGLKNEAGELFLAARNTRPDRLGSTAVAADFIQGCMKSCRARRVVLFLDCCYGGAFGQGVVVRGSGPANVMDSFPLGKLGGGRGRAVFSASSAMEYAFEGSELAQERQQPSIFTSALVHGLESGEADRDEDGLISLNELYDYIFDKVREQNPNQTPTRDVEMQGELYLAQSRRKKISALAIPAEVQKALMDPNMFTRLGAVSELRARLNSADIAAALGAHAALTELSRTDIKYVGDAAAEALSSAAVQVVEAELEFGRVPQGADTVPMTLHLQGPAVARSCTFEASDRWIRIKQAADGPRITIDTSHQGRLRGSVTVEGPTGQQIVPVAVEVIAAAEPQPSASASASVSASAQSAAAPSAQPAASPSAQSAAPASEAPQPTPRGPGAWVALGSGAGLLRLTGWATAVAGAMMIAGTLMSFQYDSPATDRVPDLIWCMRLLGLVAIPVGVSMLASRTRGGDGPGLVLGVAATSAWGVSNLLGIYRYGNGDGFNLGFGAQMVAGLLLVAAGCLTAAALARMEEVTIRRLSRRDRLAWLIVALGAIGALLMFMHTIDVWSGAADAGYPWYGAQTVWVAILALAFPVGAVLLRPARLGTAVLVGWLVGATGLVTHFWWIQTANDGDRSRITLFGLTLLALAAAAVAGRERA